MIKTKPSRYPSRATEDKTKIYKVVDAGLYCTVAFVRDGLAHQIPTGYCRVENDIYIHASAKSGFMDAIVEKKVSYSITSMDALVLSPTAFDHSFNYKSVIGFSVAEELTNPSEKHKFFNLFTDRYIPGRIADVGEPTEDQVRITRIVKLSLENAAAKIRIGEVGMKLEESGPWCGVVPINTSYGVPEKDAQLPETMKTPSYIEKLVNEH